MGVTCACGARKDYQQVHRRGQGYRISTSSATAVITSILGALLVVGSSSYEHENVITPSVTTLRLVENFDMHLQQFTDLVEEEANQQEKNWLRLGSEIDHVLARLELPLDASEEELETTTAPSSLQDDLPEWKHGEADAADAADLDGQDTEAALEARSMMSHDEPKQEGYDHFQPPAASDASQTEGEQLDSSTSPAVHSSSQGAAEVSSTTVRPEESVTRPATSVKSLLDEPPKKSTESPNNTPDPTSSIEDHGDGDRHRGIPNARSSSTEASSSTSEAPIRKYRCAPGQGQSGHAIALTHHTREKPCARECDKNKGCHGFDYTHMRSADACRLYGHNKPRIGYHATGSAHRQYCSLMQQQVEKGHPEPGKKQHSPSSADTRDHTRRHHKSTHAKSKANLAKKHPKSNVKSAESQTPEEIV